VPQAGGQVRRFWPAALAALALAAPATAAHAQQPIPEGPNLTGAPRPEFEGTRATANPIRVKHRPPRHPFMAANGRSNLHEDAWQTDVTAHPAVLGGPMTRTSTFYAHECASITFDSQGRLVTICVGLDRPVLKLLEPVTLKELATRDLPARQTTPGADTFTNFAGGGYFYLDHRDRAVVPTGDRHIVTFAVNGDTFDAVSDVDLSGVLASGDAIISALPDWFGGIWFASTNGVVGRIAPRGGKVTTRDLGEHIGNSFAVDEWGSVYVVTDAALYRLDTGDDGRPRIRWRQTYDNVGTRKSGQTQAGSGTTPTILPRGYIAITDNADPMKVVVYDRRVRPRKGRPRQVCAVPVFQPGASATDQSLIAAGRAIITTNNHGYVNPTSTENGKSTTPGVWRVDVNKRYTGCRVRWHNDQIAAPSSVPKVALATGLTYVYEKVANDNGDDLWYLTALDFRTGAFVWRRLAGEGLGFNDTFAPVTFGPDGTFYTGVLGGMVSLRETG
jgi:hypothetical protein